MSSASSSSSSSSFVNVGLERWEKQRAIWRAPRTGIPSKKLQGEIRFKSVDVEDIIERLFAQNGGGVLPESLSLGQMIDILIDFWEADDLYT